MYLSLKSAIYFLFEGSHSISITFLQNFSTTYSFLMLKKNSSTLNSNPLVVNLTCFTSLSRQPGRLEYKSLKEFEVKLDKCYSDKTLNSEMY